MTLDRTYMIHIAEWCTFPVSFDDKGEDATALVFMSVFTDQPGNYVASFAQQLASRINMTFRYNVDWEPVTTNKRLIDYVRHHNLREKDDLRKTDHFYYSAYLNASVTDVVQALKLRRGAGRSGRRFTRGPNRGTAVTSQVAYAIAARRLPQWRSSTFWFRCTGATACEIRAAVNNGPAEDLFNSVSGAHFASATVIDSVRVGAGRRPLDTPYLILSIQHDGSVKDLIAHLAEPKQRELLGNALHFAEDFAEAKDVRAFLQNHRAKTALTVTSYPRHSLAVVHTALANRERLVRLQNGSAVRQLGHTASTGKPDVRYLERTQGNILKGYSTEYVHGAYALMQVHEPDAARDWIRQLADRITTAESKPTEETTINLGFSHAGLVALGVGKCQLKWCSKAFEEGMPKRAAEHLGDVDCSAPDHWIHGPTRPAQLILALRGRDLTQLDAELEALLDSAAPGFCHVHIERGRLIVDYVKDRRKIREPFGFRDGISQPRIAEHGDKGQPDAIRVGEFLLGHEDEDGSWGPAYGPDKLWRHGAYLVYRKLHQDITAFHKFLDDHATPELPREDLAASLLGRTFDGGVPEAMKGRNGELTYRKDPKGELCPIAAHIRRANPRDSLDKRGTRGRRHRMLRRGIPYLDPAEPDGEVGGLLFMAFCANLDRQFEFVQRSWLVEGNVFGLVGQPDIVVGQPDTLVVRANPKVHTVIPQLVTTKDGEYFFMPSKPAIRGIAANEFADDSDSESR